MNHSRRHDVSEEDRSRNRNDRYYPHDKHPRSYPYSASDYDEPRNSGPPPLDYDMPHDDRVDNRQSHKQSSAPMAGFVSATDSYRPSGNSHRRPDQHQPPSRSTFDFRPPGEHSSNAPSFPPQRSQPATYRSRNDRPDRPRRREPRSYKPRMPNTSDRDLMMANDRPTTPDLLAGMADGVSGYIETDASPVSKKAKFTQTRDDSTPSWSNVDQYQLDDPNQQPRKDVVDMIRTSKIEAEQKQNTAGKGTEYISLVSDGSSDHSDQELDTSFSHLNHLHPHRKSMNEERDNAKVAKPKSKSKRKLSDASRSHTAEAERPDKKARVYGRQSHGSEAQPEKNSKKRTHDALERDVMGSVSYEWYMKADSANKITPATPWFTKPHNGPPTQDASNWLHQEILDFYRYVQPKPFEERIRNDLVERIRQCVTRSFAKVKVHTFGSFASKVYLPTADMDMVTISAEFEHKGRKLLCRDRRAMLDFADVLKRGGIPRPGSVLVIASARVPIIKFIDNMTGLHVDMAFENTSGIKGSEVFDEWRRKYPAMLPIVSLLKQFVLMRDVNDVSTGGIGGFSLICLATMSCEIVKMQQGPDFKPEEHLDMVLLSCFETWSLLDTSLVALDMKKMTTAPKDDFKGRRTQADRLCIIDPNNPDNDISGGTRLFNYIQGLMGNAYALLLRRLDEVCDPAEGDTSRRSILECAWAGNYSSFDDSRALLKRVHDKNYGTNTKDHGSASLQSHQLAANVHHANDAQAVTNKSADSGTNSKSKPKQKSNANANNAQAASKKKQKNKKKSTKPATQVKSTTSGPGKGKPKKSKARAKQNKQAAKAAA